MTDTVQRRAALEGARAILPLNAVLFPLGLVYGVTVSEAAVDDWVGGLASTLVFAAAAQLALIDLIADDAAWITAVSTALVINLRFVMYSAALAPSFAQYPAAWRLPLAYLMTDQATGVSLLHNETERDPLARRWYYLGAAVPLFVTWLATTWLGIAFGASIPSSWELGFAVPLTFICLLIPSIRDRARLVAAIVGGVVSLLARDAPNSTGLLIGAAAGVAAGMAVDR
ncbi:MAG: AzlC family ABC transporter permease [Actinomycetota bacterium]